jgi:hypothetical protein
MTRVFGSRKQMRIDVKRLGVPLYLLRMALIGGVAVGAAMLIALLFILPHGTAWGIVLKDAILMACCGSALGVLAGLYGVYDAFRNPRSH